MDLRSKSARPSGSSRGAARGSITRVAAAAALALVVASAPHRALAARYDGWSLAAGSSWSGFQGGLGEALGDTRLGPRAAIAARFRVGDLLSLQPEVGWVTKGAAESLPIGIDAIDYEWRLEYLETPVLVRADWRTGPLRPFLLAGPSMAFRVGGSRGSEYRSATARSRRVDFARIFESISATSLEGVQRWDVGAAAGAGIAIGSGSIRFMIEGRYTHGFRDVVRHDDIGGGNRSFGVTAGIEMR